MTELEYLIKERILKNGPITFSDFMNLTLYHPEFGYYSTGREKIGKKGDFYTSPHVSPVFGEVIGSFIETVFNYLGVSSFSILEFGAGKGYLASDILNYLAEKREIYNVINYIIIDKMLNKNYTDSLIIHNNKINIFNDISKLENIFEGVVISNELFDSLPFHRIIYQKNEFYEIYVNYENNKFKEIIGDVSSEEIINYLNNYDLKPADSKQIEVNLNAKDILNDIKSYLNRGYILTIDYGYLSEEYFSNERINGTFRCFYKHTINDNPYINIGDQDITADVDFTNLIQHGIQLGLEKVKYTTQGQFLLDWGILKIVEREIKKPGHININSIKNLFMPGMMGNYFKVLLQSKKVQKAHDIYPQSNVTISFDVK